MIYNLIKVALRNIRKDAAYSLINIFGITIGMASSLFILMYILDELRYDKYHENAENIYKVVSHISEPDDEFVWPVAQIPFAPQAKEDYPEVENYVRFIDMRRTLFKRNNLKFYENDVFYVDSTVFNVFTYEFVEGSPEHALDEPNTIVLTETFAHRYFSDESPIGQTIETSAGDIFKVTSVIKDVPSYSNQNFSALISRNTLPAEIGSWGNFGVNTYLLLPNGYDHKLLEKKFPKLYEKFMAEIFERMGIKIEYILQPILDIHFQQAGKREMEKNDNSKYLSIFAYVALFILFIACINYINLATARSSRRAKEVGIRKVVGSNRRQLIWQFITESIVITIFSLALGIILVNLLLPFFNNVSHKHIDPEFLLNTRIIASIICIVLFVGIIAGSYPAFFLSKFDPVNVLKGKLAQSRGNVLFRKILVVIQFSISIFMIISTWVVFDQVKFLTSKDLGFNKENVVVISLPSREIRRQFPVLKEALLKNPKIKSVGTTSTRVGKGSGKIILLMETSEGMVEKGINLLGVDPDFVEALKFKFIEGRNFSEEMMSDTLSSVIINETLAKRMNWDDPIGKKVQIGRDTASPPARVIGLIKDYHQTGLYNEIESLLWYYRYNNYLLHAKIAPFDIAETVQYIEDEWNKLFPDQPFESTFLEDEINAQVEGDENRGVIFSTFSILAVLISCLGLFGLSSFTVDQRKKEVVIRKILGADTNSIIYLLSKEFSALVFISIAITIPIAIWYLNLWLQDYTYKTDLNVFIFVLSALATIVITLLTVSFHIVKASRANPADMLSDE